MSEPANSTNRQQPTRHSTLCRGKLFAGDREVDCEVLNISVGGAKLRLAEPVEVDSDVRVRIERVGEFSGRVAWRNGATLGIEFHEELREVAGIVEDILNEGADPGEPRHAARTSVLWSGKLHSAGQIVNCRVLNISARGAQIRCQKPFDCGLNVILYIDRIGEFAGTLIWQDGAILGIAFQNGPEHIARVLGGVLPTIRQGDA